MTTLLRTGLRTRLSHLSAARQLPKSRTFAVSARQHAVYGFIGLGQMGLPMAKNLRNKINADDTLLVHDVNASAPQQLLAELQGTRTEVASSARELADRSDTIITSLPEPSHVSLVFEEVLKSTLKAPTSTPTRLFIDCSTIDPITSRAVAANVAKETNGTSAFVDAPMSGGVVGATAGTLTFMLGAPAELVERATTVLGFMGRRVVHLGDQGAGLCGKLANNYLLALNNIATAEAMAMGISWGLDPKALAGMINTSTGRCWPSEVNNPVPGAVDGTPAGRDYKGGFGISLMQKDLRLALEAAREFGVRNELGDVASRVYGQASADERCKGRDFSVVYRWLDGPARKPDL